MANSGFLGLWTWLGVALLAISALFIQPAAAFCVRNDTGEPVKVEAIEDSAVFNVEIANNQKACCDPKDAACGISQDKVQLSISSSGSKAMCSVAVGPKGNINVTGRPDQLKCKANKAGSTMDWASG